MNDRDSEDPGWDPISSEFLSELEQDDEDDDGLWGTPFLDDEWERDWNEASHQSPRSPATPTWHSDLQEDGEVWDGNDGGRNEHADGVIKPPADLFVDRTYDSPTAAGVGVEAAWVIGHDVLTSAKERDPELRFCYVLLPKERQPETGSWGWKVVTPNGEALWLTRSMFLPDRQLVVALQGGHKAVLKAPAWDIGEPEVLDEVVLCVPIAPGQHGVSGIEVDVTMRAVYQEILVLCVSDPVPNWPR